MTYNAAINACENSAEWLQVRERSWETGLPQDELMIADDVNLNSCVFPFERHPCICLGKIRPTWLLWPLPRPGADASGRSTPLSAASRCEAWWAICDAQFLWVELALFVLNVLKTSN